MLDIKIDNVIFEETVIIPETSKKVQYNINHLLEEKSILLQQIADKNTRISDIDALVTRASDVGVESAVKVIASDISNDIINPS